MTRKRRLARLRRRTKVNREPVVAELKRINNNMEWWFLILLIAALWT